MKKFMIYRAPKQVDRNLGEHVLIAIENGEDIHMATDDIIQAISDDLSENPEYDKCDVSALPPEDMSEFSKTKRYQYSATGIVSPPNAAQNILIEYGIIEQDAD